MNFLAGMPIRKKSANLVKLENPQELWLPFSSQKGENGFSAAGKPNNYIIGLYIQREKSPPVRAVTILGAFLVGMPKTFKKNTDTITANIDKNAAGQQSGEQMLTTLWRASAFTSTQFLPN